MLTLGIRSYRGLHACWRGKWTDFRPSRSGGGTVPVAAHSLRACRRAMVIRRRLHAYLGYPVAPRLARMLAREGDGTDFRPSRNGDGTVPVAAHSLRACRGAMTRRGRLYAYLGYPVAPRLERMMVWLVDVTDANRRTAVVRLRTACAKCGARCGAGSRTLAFLAPLVWHHGFKCSRPTRGRRGNARCGDATQSSSLVDYDKLRQGRGLSVGVAGFGTSNVEYLCSPALRTCGCECCVCVLCVRTCRCLL